MEVALTPLPRGPHRLNRETVASSQRTRLLRALTELMADGGYGAVTIGALARKAGVSRGAFYELFPDKEACLLAAYDDFAQRLAAAVTGELADDTPWEAFIDRLIAGYLDGVERDRVAARAFLVELDAAGPAARARRRQAMRTFATLIAQRHATIIARESRLVPLPERAYAGFVLGVRELVREALEDDVPATELASEIKAWITAMIEGARR